MELTNLGRAANDMHAAWRPGEQGSGRVRADPRRDDPAIQDADLQKQQKRNNAESVR